jgi:imidazole glycerol-phosphate synthase subunit HisH
MSRSALSLIDEPVEIAVVDYGMGNRRSVEKALEHVGARARVTSDHARLRAAAGLIVPGVGAFPRAMGNLRELGLGELLRERVAAGTPVLGICLGMQLAFDSSTELGGAAGLGIVSGEVRALASSPEGEPGELKLPHIGWNEVRFTQPDSPLVADLPACCAFYHVHSFAPVPAETRDVLGVAEYGAPFVSAVQRGCFYGVQFHPEKSSAAGLRLLANFARICIVAAGHADGRVSATSAHGAHPEGSDAAAASAEPPPVAR